MINHNKKIIFIHIPKTGGASISSHLHEHGLISSPPFHQTIEYYCHKYGLDLIKDYVKIVTIRNPWDRLLSIYAHRRSRTKQHIEETRTNFDNNFLLKYEGWIEGLNAAKTLDFKDYIKWCIKNEPNDHPGVQSCYYYIKNSYQLKFSIIRFENIQDDYAKVCKQIGIKPDKLPKIDHGSKHSHYTEYYDKELVEIVASYCLEDIEHFGYQFKKKLNHYM